MWVKICGITSERDARLAADAGADAIGFVFWPRSRRYISVERAAEIGAALPAGIEKIGVFVNELLTRVEAIAAEAALTRVQLHGNETPDVCARLRVKVVKAFAVGPSFRPARLDAFGSAVTVLLDAEVRGTPGGTGKVLNWAVARRVSATRETILAGGLTPDNVADAVREVRPFGVDVSSGVELRPGVKDAGRLQRFVEAVRRAER
jgi:phosphoribosylanthranilate isomerase